MINAAFMFNTAFMINALTEVNKVIPWHYSSLYPPPSRGRVRERGIIEMNSFIANPIQSGHIDCESPALVISKGLARIVRTALELFPS